MTKAALPRLTEKEFMGQVVTLARFYGWLVYHTHDSRRSAPGYPDLTLVHPIWCKVIWAEVKVPGGRTTTEQRRWLSSLVQAGGRAFCWRPSDWPEIERVLGGG